MVLVDSVRRLPGVLQNRVLLQVDLAQLLKRSLKVRRKPTIVELFLPEERSQLFLVPTLDD